LHIVANDFVNEQAGKCGEEIDQHWKELKQHQPKLFNGDVMVMEEYEIVDGSLVAYGTFTDYKTAVAAKRVPALSEILKPIGVSGIVTAFVNDATVVVIGKRSATVTQYPGSWELVPAGSIDKSHIQPDNTISINQCILQELKEETGIGVEEVDEVRTIGLVWDKVECLYDICCLVRLKKGVDITKRFIANSEYTSFLCLPVADLEAWISSEKDNMVPASLAILRVLAETNELTKVIQRV
jgi:8-oxo-dGTP pyrophosphatase MutT (NUDIX family)